MVRESKEKRGGNQSFKTSKTPLNRDKWTGNQSISKGKVDQEAQRFKCDQCDASFLHRTNVYRHKKAAHGEDLKPTTVKKMAGIPAQEEIKSSSA